MLGKADISIIITNKSYLLLDTVFTFSLMEFTLCLNNNEFIYLYG